MNILNKVIRRTEEGIEMEADPRHVELIMRELELEKARSSKSPGSKAVKSKSESDKDQERRVGRIIVNDEEEDGKKEDEEEEELGGSEATKFRGVVARWNYILPDRTDVQYAVKDVARCMAKRKRGNWNAVRRIARYLKGRPRMITHFKWQTAQHILVGYADSDWAGCGKSGRSTSG